MNITVELPPNLEEQVRTIPLLRGRNSLLATAVTIFLWYCFGTFVDAAAIYWTQIIGPAGTHSIQRADSEGSGIETVVTGLSHPRGITLDVGNDRMYWMEPGVLKIRSAKLDGSSPTDVVATNDGAAWLALDPNESKMYWTDSDGSAINSGQITGRIRRANLDGTNIENLVTQNLVHPVGIALDLLHGKIYWTNLEHNFDGTGEIQRSNLDGTNVENILTGIDEANSLTIDAIGGKLYWTDLRTKSIQRSNMDGTGLENVVTGLDSPTSVALNLSEGKMYWTNAGPPASENLIQRSNLDGTNVENVVSGNFFPWGLAIVPEPSSLILIAIGFAALSTSRRRQPSC